MLRLQSCFGFDHHETRLRQLPCVLKRRDYVTDSFHPGAAPAQKKRHVRAQSQGNAAQLCQVQFQVPEPVERQQHGGGIGGAAAHARLCGNALVHTDVRALRAAGGLLQRARSAQRQVVVWQGVGQVFPAENAIGAALEVQRYTDAVRQDLYAPIYQVHGDYEQVHALESARRLLEFTWLTLPEISPLTGLTLGQARIRSRTGATVVAIMRRDGLVTNPGLEEQLRTGDVLAVLGNHAELALFTQLAAVNK